MQENIHVPYIVAIFELYLQGRTCTIAILIFYYHSGYRL